MPEPSSSTAVPRRRSWSISAKLIGAVLIGIATTTLISTVASGWREAERFAEAKRAEIEGTAHVLSSAVAEAVAENDRMGVLKALRAIGKIPSFEYARVEDTKGRVIGQLGAAVSLQESADTSILLRRTIETRVPVVKDGSEVGTVSVLVNTSELKQRLIDGSITGLLAALAAAILGVAVALRLQERITRPLRHLTSTMSAIRETHDFSGSVESGANDETGVLIDTFNDMMGQIRQRDDRLARHRETLEQTVEERTHDLKIAKEVAEDANAAKSDFLATMSHEIRTPMNGMLVMAELLASANLSDRHRRYADVVVKSGQSLLTIINDILDFSKIESGKMELECIELDPSNLVDDVLNLFWDKAARKGLDLAGYVAPDVPDKVTGDPVRLNQVLSNLVNNALKFTEQGHVKVNVAWATDTDEPALRFAVTDTGIGIPQDKLATVFDSFSQADQTTTRRFGGTGLGLAICKRLVTAMGGQISVVSTEGEGSEFFFSVAQATSEAYVGATGRSEKDRRLRRAVVAVDSAATSDAIAAYLGDAGIEVDQMAIDCVATKGQPPADVVLAAPNTIADLTAQGATASGTYMVCLSQLGDNQSDDLIASERAHDVLMRPVSRNTMRELIDRLERGEPRGRSLLGRRKPKRLPAYPDSRVLIADDSPVNREVVTEALKQMDVVPDTVEDGAAAVDAAAANAYDLIFMDCSMPVMDGFEATRQIRRAEEGTGHRVPIVALTAHVAGGSADAWRDAGMDAYMSKPFRITDLVDTFNAYLPGGMLSTDRPVELEEDGEGATDQPADDNSVAEAPAIDQEVLCAALGCEPGEMGDLILNVLSIFEQHGPQALLTLAEKAKDGSNKDIGDAAHALKSMARNIGAIRLGMACDELERQARDGKVSRVAMQLSGLQSELIATLEKISEIKAAAADADAMSMGNT